MANILAVVKLGFFAILALLKAFKRVSQRMKTQVVAFLLILKITVFAQRIIRPKPDCECGIVNSVHERIVGGIDAEINEFPWTVGLFTHNRCRGLPVCGGTLISAQHVLTAAHCIQRNLVSYFGC